MLSSIFNLSEGYTLLVVAAGASILGAVSGIVGSYALIKKQSLLADAISHASLPGIVLAFIIAGTRSNPVLLTGAAIAGLLAATQILLLIHRRKLKQDSSLSLMLAVYFGLGMVLLTIIQHNPGSAQAGIEKFLFGETATMLINDVKIMAGAALAIILLLIIFSKELYSAAFDREYAAASGLPVIRLDILFTVIMVTTVAIGLQTVGVVLMSALLVAPAAAARQWTNSFRLMVFLSMIFGIVSGVVGSIVSSEIPLLPTGPTIVVTASLITLISFLFAPKRGLISTHYRRRKKQDEANANILLKILYMLSVQHGQDPLHGHPLSVLRSLFPLKDNLRINLTELKTKGYAVETETDYWAITAEGISYIKQNFPTQANSEANP